MNEVFFKRFPCCFATHAALTALLDLGPRLDPAAIETVDLDVCPTTLLVADQRQPDTGLGGKFSMTYCAASALLRGHVRRGPLHAPRRSAIRRRARWRAACASFPRRSSTRREPGPSCGSATGPSAREVGDLRLGRDPERLRREPRREVPGPHRAAARRGGGARLRDALGRVDEIDDLTELTRGARS